jgi:beta-galactosidase
MRFHCPLSFVLFAVTLAASPLFAQATRYADAPPLLTGAAWYPEQWPESRWDADLTLMEAAHIHLVRVAEFAWSTMEPAEGEYHWEWLDHAIAAASKHHIVVVLGTPTATPPAWMTRKYPEILRVEQDGRVDEHGNRQQFSFANPHYRELARDIVRRMAERYGKNPDVVGWQIDNEISALSFDKDARDQWHAWLKAKYKTTDALNTAWTTAYWSETYDSFDEVAMHDHNENPGLLLDFKRFVTATWVSYTQNQVDALRPNIDPRQFITTNTMGWFDGFDAYKEHANLDIAAWDDYVPTEVFDWADNGAEHDLARGFKHKNFWVMETEPAFVNWRPNNNPLNKGQVREMAWQAIGHGADAVEYWQWRSDLNGQEEYHGVLVGANGEPVPVYKEVQQIGEEFDRAGKALAGTEPVAHVALLNDYDSRWAIDFQRHNKAFDPVAQMIAYYRPLREQSQGVDVISPLAPLAKYKLVVAPGLNVLPDATAQHLIEYVRGGGNLLLGPRSGMKGIDNGLDVHEQPGALADLLGAHVSQFYALARTVPIAEGGSASLWAETLDVTSPETKTLMTYGPSNGWLDGQPAVVTRKVGKGSITYVGAWLDDSLLAKITASLLADSAVKPLMPGVPDGVEVCVRSGKGRSVVILINHNTSPVTVTVPSGMRDLLGTATGASANLPAYGVAVYEAPSTIQ